MALENKTQMDALLKNVYTDVVREQVAINSPVHDMFVKETDAQWSGDGRQAIELAVMSLNEGVGAIAEDANLPTAGNFDPQNFTISMKYVYGSFKATEQIIRSAMSSKGAFKNFQRMSMDTLTRNMKRERARMIFGSGTGLLARVNGAQSSQTVIEVDDPGGVTGSVGGARYLRKGMILAIDSATDVACTVTSVAADGLSFTTGSLSCDDNSPIYRISTAAGIANTNEWGKDNEPLGLMGIIDDGTLVGTYQSLSRTTYPQLKSRIESSVGALTADVLYKNIDIAMQLGDGEISMLAMHPSVRRAYVAMMEGDRRYSGANLAAPDAGTNAVKRNGELTFGGIPITWDPNCPYGTVFGIDKRDMKRYVQVDGEWAENDGGILRQDTATGLKDTWTAFYRLWENYHCSRPNTCFRLDGVTATAVYVASY